MKATIMRNGSHPLSGCESDARATEAAAESWIARALRSRRRTTRRRTAHRVGPGAAWVETLEPRALLAGDLIAQWRAEDLAATLNSGDTVATWVDLKSSVPAVASGTPKLVEGALGGRAAIRFAPADGADGFVVAEPRNPLSRANDFSVMVTFATSTTNLQGGTTEWFRNTGLVDGSNLGFAPDWGLSINASGQIAAGMGGGFGKPSQTVYSPAGGWNDGQVHVATITRSGSQLSLYVDDQRVASRTDVSSEPRASLGMAFGQLLTGDNPFTGDLAEIRVYNGPLSEGEVQAGVQSLRNYYNNRPPVVQDDSYSSDEDAAFFAIAAPGVLANDQDPDGDAMTAVLVTPPVHGKLTLQPNGSFFYDSDPNFFGEDSFTYRAKDLRESPQLATVRLRILPKYDAAVPVADGYKAQPRVPLTVAAADGVLANDINPDAIALQAVLDTPVTAGSLDLRADGSFTYDPQGFHGTATFGYRVQDAVTLSAPVTVTLVVNTAPQTMADTYSTIEDSTLSVNAAQGLLANDVDADGDPLSVTLDVGPARGQLTLQADGSFAYVPEANYAGPDTFSYRVTDGVDTSGPTTVLLTMTAVNDIPVAVPDSYLAIADRPTQVTAELGVLANDSDVEGSPLSASLVTGPQYGTLSLEPSGAFNYTPNTGFRGVDGFTYRAADGTANSAEVRVRLNVTAQPLVISEFMASSATAPTTIVLNPATSTFVGEKLTPDWIELRNLVDSPVSLAGLFLTDEPWNPTKWAFPGDTIIPAMGHLVVYASGLDIRNPSQDQTGRLHTNFQLTEGGEYLALMSASGEAIHAYGPEYPAQRTDLAYGLDAKLTPGFLTTATPGADNGTVLPGLVADTRFSVDRGFFKAPFPLEILTDTPGAVIRYTTDGSVPTDSTGTQYAGPITVDRTTTIRARAFAPGLVPTNVDTHSYFFTADVVNQTAATTLAAGFPARWGTTPPDYGLDSDDQFPLIAGNKALPLAEAKAVVEQSLVAIPSISLVMNITDMFGARGIYTNPNSSGSAWERPTSVEWVNPDGTDGFQTDAGVRIQGGAFRDYGLTKKKSFRLLFKTKYGDSTVKYPIFGAGGAQEFDTLTLRMESNDGWQWGDAGGQPQYARDEFMRRTQLAMGQPAPRGRNVHLYINGVYWGMYNVVERPDDSFGAAYFGSDRYAWDGQNSGTPTNSEGDSYRTSRGRTAWSTLTRMTASIRTATTEQARTAYYMEAQGLNADGSDNPQAPRYLDPVNYSDYLIANYYGGNADWPFKNYYLGRENSADSDGFKFFVWDAEWSLLLRSNRSQSLITDSQGVALPFRDLRTSLEFRTLFGDRVHKHAFNGGALYVDPANSKWDPAYPERNVPAARYMEITDRIAPGLIAESARWGDQHRATPYTRNVEWNAERNRVLAQWFPTRTNELVGLFRTLGLYPKTAAATFAQRGGVLSPGQQVALQAATGAIYYTLDDSDPRSIGGGVSPSARLYEGPFTLQQSSQVRVRVLNGTEWSAIDEAKFLVNVVPATAANLRVSEVHYHPADPSTREVAAGFRDADAFEFIELVNISSETIDLSNTRLATIVVGAEEQGVDFNFASSPVRLLAPGQRVVVVEDLAAFNERYRPLANISVAGQWQGTLSNRSETITVRSGDALLQQFTYQDAWHPSTDGPGYSLEIIDPAANDLTAWSRAAAWKASNSIGGSPGSAASATVTGDVNDDGQFNSTDLVIVFQAGKYEDGIIANATYAEGDWNGDGDFTSADLIKAFQEGTYVSSSVPRAARGEEEPSATAPHLAKLVDAALAVAPRGVAEAFPAPDVPATAKPNESPGPQAVRISCEPRACDLALAAWSEFDAREGEEHMPGEEQGGEFHEPLAAGSAK